MTERAHIRNSQIVRFYQTEKGWLIDENGKKFASPVLIGYDDGTNKVVIVERETDDQSLTNDTKSSTVTTVEANRVHVLTTIVDKTLQEIDDEQTALAVSQADAILGQLCKFLMAGQFELANRVIALEGGNAITVAQYIAFINNLVDNISDADFRDKVKEIVQSGAQPLTLMAEGRTEAARKSLGSTFMGWLKGK